MTSIALRHAAFAVLATLANLAMQRLVLTLGDTSLIFAFAVLAGAAVGLVLKYVLDKRWIFYDRATGLGAQSRSFSLYFATGIVTTAIFWGMETAFWLIWETDVMRELGAIIALSVGFVSEFFLDRRFVFGTSRDAYA